MGTTGISFHDQTVEVLVGVAHTDRYGNDTTDWGAPIATPVAGCRLVPVPGGEVLDRVTRRWVLYAPPEAVITAASRVRWEGIVYDVTGEVRRWKSATGRLAHIEADLQRVEG
jgi:hypothetical protein